MSSFAVDASADPKKEKTAVTRANDRPSQAVQTTPASQTPTTLFSDCPISPSEEYKKIIDPERRKIIAVLIVLIIFVPLMFRYACGSSNSDDVGSKTIAWGSHISGFEWAALVVIWLGALGTIFRLLPMVSGRPSAIESSQKCTLDGVAVLGLVSPFSSEDDAILLRSLLGRTCTVFHTVGSRHSMQGLYLDTILNERRIKGEANRRNCWLAWMKFLNALIDVSLMMKEEATAAQGFGATSEKSDLSQSPCNASITPGRALSPRNAPITPGRALYVHGAVDSRGVSFSVPRPQSVSVQEAQCTTPGVVTFKDIGASLDSTLAVSEHERNRLHAWSQKHSPRGRPSSCGYATGAGQAQQHTGRKALGQGLEESQHSLGGNRQSDGSAGKDRRSAHSVGGRDSRAAKVVSFAMLEDIDEATTATESSQYTVPYERVYPGRGGTASVQIDSLNDALEEASYGDSTEYTVPYDRIYPDEFSFRDEDFERDPANRDCDSVRSDVTWSERSMKMVSDAARQMYGVFTEAGNNSQVGPTGENHLYCQSSTATFPLNPSRQPRPLTSRHSLMGSSFLRRHGVPNLRLNMADLVPMIDFLDAWLEEMKTNEWTYDYHKPKLAVEKLFFAAPFLAHFRGHHMLAVHAALNALFTAFATPVPDEPDPKRPYHPDEVSEVEWVLHRENLPDWTVVWSYASRARLREMKRTDIQDPHGPDPVYQSMRIKPGTIVYRRPPADVIAELAPYAYFRARQALYKVDTIEPGPDGRDIAHLLPFCPPPGVTAPAMSAAVPDLETGQLSGTGTTASSERVPRVVAPLGELVLIEMNRGKAGALNFFNEYLRTKALKWSRSHGLRNTVQTFTGIVDARHALVETDIFWNDALPYFARVESTGKPGKRFGGLTEHSICITVQYPQYFTNVGDDDVLDNTNSTYYNLWQTLRDSAKCICSSGTNTIWDISNPSFEFCTTSRSEDLGTSHEYIPHCASVYLCIHVAFGIAKKTEDFLEALYRWSAGPQELLWPSFFKWKIVKHYVYVAVPTTIMALASFHEHPYWYFAHLAMMIFLACKACRDRWLGRKPLRDFIVSTVVSINLFIVCSNLMSIMWNIVFPIQFAFYGQLPLGNTRSQGLFWAWLALFGCLTSGIVHDSVIRMARHTAPATKQLNYDKCLWRGAQLYSCSFMFTLMATIGGSWSAFKAWWWDSDLSMWSSFRVSNSEFDKLNKSVQGASVFSPEYMMYLYKYARLYLHSCLTALTMPTIMTKWYVTGVYLLQIIAIIVSTFVTNRDDLMLRVVTILSCTFNILMIGEVAMLLQPLLRLPFGFPCRVDYLFTCLGVVVFFYAVASHAITLDSIGDRLHLLDLSSL